jgi:hypothetical protein
MKAIVLEQPERLCPLDTEPPVDPAQGQALVRIRLVGKVALRRALSGRFALPHLLLSSSRDDPALQPQLHRYGLRSRNSDSVGRGESSCAVDHLLGTSEKIVDAFSCWLRRENNVIKAVLEF